MKGYRARKYLQVVDSLVTIPRPLPAYHTGDDGRRLRSLTSFSTAVRLESSRTDAEQSRGSQPWQKILLASPWSCSLPSRFDWNRRSERHVRPDLDLQGSGSEWIEIRRTCRVSLASPCRPGAGWELIWNCHEIVNSL